MREIADSVMSQLITCFVNREEVRHDTQRRLQWLVSLLQHVIGITERTLNVTAAVQQQQQQQQQRYH